MKPLKLGVIGLSTGNGHPYSWSAIFNGYDPITMEECGFPAIPRYLEKQQFPKDSISEANVTHVWTQDIAISNHLAASANITNVVKDPEDMIGQVDGILLARDDAETHYKLAAPFLEAGLPIYIDKPICLSEKELDDLYALQKFPGQIFSCSAVSYGHEFQLTDAIRTKVGVLQYIYASTPKDWEKYGIHVIEPLLKISGDQGKLHRYQRWAQGDNYSVNYSWDSGFQATVAALGDLKCPISLRLVGDNGWHDMVFLDSFYAFKAVLLDFVRGIVNRDVRADPEFMRKVVRIIDCSKSDQT